MATKGIIAATRDTAIRGLTASGQSLASLLGLEPPNLNLLYRDYDYLQAEQLKELAAFNERVLQAIEGLMMPSVNEPEIPLIGDMTVAQLKQYAADNGIDLGEVTRKEDIKAVILMAQGAGV